MSARDIATLRACLLQDPAPSPSKFEAIMLLLSINLPEHEMTDDELLAYLRDQFDEPTLDVELWSEGTFRVSVTQKEMDEHYINDEFAWGKTPRAALLNCIHRHGKGMKRERLP